MNTTTEVTKAFLEGKALKKGNVQTNGRELYLFGNKIAEHRTDGLYITDAGWPTRSTHRYLNTIPNVYVNSHKKQQQFRGHAWDGEWIKVEGVKVPVITEEQEAKNRKKDIFSTQTRYIKTDGWRGYSEPIYAVCGANNTGDWSDSPAPSSVCEQEINAAKAYLAKNGVNTKIHVCETSNVFCVHVYLIAPVAKIEQARKLFAEYYEQEQHNTRLLYEVKG